ncbi:MAG: hypothetical protein IKR48_03380 [Kiritimatiellae bacterium]|nr:hypothetical protein [Kiritimatiellia bacterium]
MNFLLKIVQGPNTGAEIALVSGLTVSLGKSDSCDIILADPTLPDEPIQIETGEDRVTVHLPDGGGSVRLEPFHVTNVGTTAFAVGPSDGVWGSLVWPKPETPVPEAGETPAAATPEEGEMPEATAPVEPPPARDEEGKRRSRIPGCLLILLVLALILAALFLVFRPKIVEYWENRTRLQGTSGEQQTAQGTNVTGEVVQTQAEVKPIDRLVERYALSVTNRNNRQVLSGNFRTRAERLAATAESYATEPGVELDFSDDESLRTAAEDTLTMIGSGSLRVANVTNRVIVLSGKVSSPETLRRVLETLSSEVPRLENVDMALVSVDAPTTPAPSQGTVASTTTTSRRSVKAREKKDSVEKPSKPELPVCGVLIDPYPCLVMRNGTRLLEGGQIGESTILKIESDQITLTNSMGVIVWKP